jgi:phosphoglycerate dehydrogenase-like enzyme
MKLLIVLRHPFELWNAPDWVAERLREDFPQLEVVHLKDYVGLDEEIKNAEIVIAWSLRPEQIKSAKHLRWVHSTAAAVHQLLFPELANSDIVLTNARGVHGPVVAEHVMALIFALAKRIPQAVRLQEKHLWGQQALWETKPRPREIAGATLGLIGLGSIGTAVAKHAAALNMRVIAAREHPGKPKPDGVSEVFSGSQLEMLLAQSDYVVLATPVTANTRQLMNGGRFAQMKPESCLINVGRGSLVDERALAEALRSRQLSGAALDVFEKEPLAADSPLWDLENLLITPHTAGLTEKLWERHYRHITENLRRYLALEPLLSVVDKNRGY